MKLDYGWSDASTFRCWGPYSEFTIDPSTSMRVTWQSKFFSKNAWLMHGLSPDSLETKLVHDADPPATTHSFLLEDLEPRTTYYYQISRPEDLKKRDQQPVYSFITAPEAGSQHPFTACIASDIHNNISWLLNRIHHDIPDSRFLISCGDCITHGGQETAWNDYFHQVHHAPSRFPILHVTGNHDTDHPETYAHFIQTFRNPYPDSSIGGFYQFTYANCRFIMLDSTNAGQTRAGQGVISDEQMEWLEKALADAAERHLWKIICLHHPIYSSMDSANLMNWYDIAYRALFDEYKVDMVFYGHDHAWEIYWRSREAPWGGTNYILCGNGGGGLSTSVRDPRRLKGTPNYIWKGRTHLHERDGILSGKLENDNVSNDIIKSSHVFGILEHGVTCLVFSGDTCDIRLLGKDGQELFMDVIKRTGQGKTFHPPAKVQSI
ncbi:hypothetical protein GF325_02100 [Candidatus Bathyarchaeota archaeon]|nr:hypothetical protein [Candidatus Bathyarchaeota archaeon]